MRNLLLSQNSSENAEDGFKDPEFETWMLQKRMTNQSLSPHIYSRARRTFMKNYSTLNTDFAQLYASRTMQANQSFQDVDQGSKQPNHLNINDGTRQVQHNNAAK